MVSEEPASEKTFWTRLIFQLKWATLNILIISTMSKYISDKRSYNYDIPDLVNILFEFIDLFL